MTSWLLPLSFFYVHSHVDRSVEDCLNAGLGCANHHVMRYRVRRVRVASISRP